MTPNQKYVLKVLEANAGTFRWIYSWHRKKTCRSLQDKGLITYKQVGNMLVLTDIRKDSKMRASEINSENNVMENVYNNTGDRVCPHCGAENCDTDEICINCENYIDLD